MIQRDLLLRFAAAIAAALPATLTAQSGGSNQAPTPQQAGSLEERLRALETRLDAKESEMQALEKKLAAKSETSKWYDRLTIRGYGQFRYTSLFNEDNTPNLNVPADRSINEPESLYLRRGRVTLSGDVSDRVYFYAQTEFAGTPNGLSDWTMQMRDYYTDIALDQDKESRLRVGLSKVPYGFVNLQSSQNRIALERADAINSAVEGERDMGVYYFWAPSHIRDLFRDLVRSGRKGSGDYGVLGFGAFTGQGPNRSDKNGDVHIAARASYPFQFGDGQVVEIGVQGYTGEYVVTTSSMQLNPSPAPAQAAPTADGGGIDDERVAASVIVYPAPIGFEAEWTWGKSPQLSDDLSRINAESIQGGYVQAHYMLETEAGVWFPFVRWNFFDGARKFATNAPKDEVNELDIGFEWQATPEIEVTMQYTHTFWRTDTSDTSGTPFEEARDVDRFGIQMQVNF